VSNRFALAAFVALLVPAVNAAAQIPARDNPSPASGSAVIRGRVVDAANGSPLVGATVAIDATGENLSALTDAAGRYEITGIPAGRYRLTARTSGYLLLDYGQIRPGEAGKPLVVPDKQVIENINFALPLGGTIAGRITDVNGDPMANVQVRALRPVYREGRKLLNADAIVYTNDLGDYRLFGLTPGGFYLSVLAPAPTGVGNAPENSGAGLAPTYFPSTTDFANARTLIVKLGETTGNVDVTVSPVNNGGVSGRATLADGTPVAGAQVNLSQVGPGLLYGSPVRTTADGAFSFNNLAPGDYEYRVSTPMPVNGRSLVAAGRLVVPASQTLQVTWVVAEMPMVSGRLVLPSGGGPPFQMSSAFNVTVDRGMVPGAAPYQARLAGSASALRFQADGTFSSPVAPGWGTFAANAMPRGWYLKAVRIDGIDVTDGFEFVAGRNVNGVEIELTNQPSEISGTARGSKGEALDDYTVLVFAQDVARRRGVTRYFATARPDAAGTFRVLGLPSGDYFAVAVAYADSDSSADPDFLETLVKDASAFTLRDGAASVLDLKMVR
jgi:hypothetical protein